MSGKTVGLVGFGAIGRQTARLLAPFDCRLLAYDPFLNEATAAALGVRASALNELLAEADFVSLHAPALPETRGLVDAAFLTKMKPGASLINTARGSRNPAGA